MQRHGRRLQTRQQERKGIGNPTLNALAILADRTKNSSQMKAAIGHMRAATKFYREGNTTYWKSSAEDALVQMEAALAEMEKSQALQ